MAFKKSGPYKRALKSSEFQIRGKMISVKTCVSLEQAKVQRQKNEAKQVVAIGASPENFTEFELKEELSKLVSIE